MKRSREKDGELLREGFHTTALPGRPGITLRRILQGATAMAQFNYMVDLPWFMQHVDTGAKVMVIHGHRDGGRSMADQARAFNVRLVAPSLPIAYGTHHTKLMVLFYGDAHARIIVHTANLIPCDWRYAFGASDVD